MSHLFISAAHKSSGKTTVSIGLCAAMVARGLAVQPFKKGPDYIDPLWLARAAGKPCFNLDFFTTEPDEICSSFAHYSSGADISLIEGNKGLYDGLDLDGSNSNAALAKLLGAPVVLVLDARGMTRGIAPLIRGYQDFDSDINIVGVILNELGGVRHEEKLRAVIEHYTDVEILGAIHRNKALEIGERHLGLIPSNELDEADKRIVAIRDVIAESVDIDRVLACASEAPVVEKNVGIARDSAVSSEPVRLGIARDAAFGFYYADDLQAMEQAGAELVFFNAISDSALPDVDALFIGGGFPETCMLGLQENTGMRKSIKNAIDAGMPVYAECGGLMYLARTVSWQDQTCEMVGAIPADAVMHESPRGRGYVRLRETGKGLWPLPETGDDMLEISAHEFHHSSLKNIDPAVDYAYEVLRGHGIDGKNDGIVYKNVMANYAHFRDTRRHHWVAHFLKFVRDCKNNR